MSNYLLTMSKKMRKEINSICKREGVTLKSFMIQSIQKNIKKYREENIKKLEWVD